MTPISVVLADDDRLVLEDLKSLINWNALGLSLITALNGTQALKYINKYHPQILITDIIMPGMNGLELIETLRKTQPDLKILIISSYDEFDYAKKAIALGVCDYILKNEITAASFTEKLLSLLTSVQKTTRMNHTLLSKELTRYFQSSTTTFPSLESIAPLRKERFYFFIASQATPFLLHMQQASEIISSSLTYLSDSLEQSINQTISFQFTNEKFLIFAIRMESTSREQYFFLSSATRQIHWILQGRSAQPCTLFYYPKQITLEAFRSLYHELLPLLRFYSVFYSPAPMNLDELKRTELFVPTPRTFSFQLLNASMEHQEETILKIKQFITLYYENRDLQAIIDFYQTFCSHMEIMSHGQLRFTEPQYFSSLEVLLKWIFNTYEDALKQSRNEETSHSPCVKAAITYMQDHYSDYNLTAEVISRHAAISPGRLNVLFKQETNRTLNEYLTALRIKEAIYFLQHTNLKIYEISEKCGYKSSQYFSQVFSQHTGKRPLDYRKTGKNPSTRHT